MTYNFSFKPSDILIGSNSSGASFDITKWNLISFYFSDGIVNSDGQNYTINSIDFTSTNDTTRYELYETASSSNFHIDNSDPVVTSNYKINTFWGGVGTDVLYPVAKWNSMKFKNGVELNTAYILGTGYIVENNSSPNKCVIHRYTLNSTTNIYMLTINTYNISQANLDDMVIKINTTVDDNNVIGIGDIQMYLFKVEAIKKDNSSHNVYQSYPANGLKITF